jgi:phosphoribosyl-ATP pyrophosphohydrolase
MTTDWQTLQTLFDTIQSRKGASPEESYTAKLFAKGRNKIAQKVGEEAVELAIAAVTDKKRGMLGESADLLYHMLVLWAECGVQPQEVMDMLKAREGVSGIEEKRNRFHT